MIELFMVDATFHMISSKLRKPSHQSRCADRGCHDKKFQLVLCFNKSRKSASVDKRSSIGDSLYWFMFIAVIYKCNRGPVFETFQHYRRRKRLLGDVVL